MTLSTEIFRAKAEAATKGDHSLPSYSKIARSTDRSVTRMLGTLSINPGYTLDAK